MKTNQYGGDSEPLSVPYSADRKVDWAEQKSELVRARHIPIAEAVASRGPFPLRTLMVCSTIWLIATQAMIFDEIKFMTRAGLLEQTVQTLGESHVVVPNEQPPNPPTGANLQRL